MDEDVEATDDDVEATADDDFEAMVEAPTG